MSAVRSSDKLVTYLVRSLLVVAAGITLIRYVNFALAELDDTHFDDAYMFLRYAKHLLAGYGMSWNVEDGTVYGLTSLTHFMVITMLRAATELPDAQVLTCSSVLYALASCVALVILGFISSQSKFVRRYWIPLLIIPALVPQKMFEYHSLTGMETMLSLLLNAVIACFAVIWARKMSGIAMGFCLGAAYLAFLTRPESGAFGLLVPPLLFLAKKRGKWMLAVKYVAIFLSILAVDALIKEAVFGDIFPLAFYAKSGDFYKGYAGLIMWNHAAFVFRLFRESLPFSLMVVFLFSRKTIPVFVAGALPLVVLLLYLGTVHQIMGAYARFYYPATAFVVFIGFAMTGHLKDELRHVSWSLIAKVTIAGLITVVLLDTRVRTRAATIWAASLEEMQLDVASDSIWVLPEIDEDPSLGTWGNNSAVSELLQSMPADIVFAASEYGVIGSDLPKMRILDTVGLHDAHLAHNGFEGSRLLSQNPDIIWLPHIDYTHIRSELINHPKFVRGFEFYPELYSAGIGLNKHSPYLTELRARLRTKVLQDFGMDISSLKASVASAYKPDSGGKTGT